MAKITNRYSRQRHASFVKNYPTKPWVGISYELPEGGYITLCCPTPDGRNVSLYFTREEARAIGAQLATWADRVTRPAREEV